MYEKRRNNTGNSGRWKRVRDECTEEEEGNIKEGGTRQKVLEEQTRE